jgi:hypothetical protein
MFGPRIDDEVGRQLEDVDEWRRGERFELRWTVFR